MSVNIPNDSLSTGQMSEEIKSQAEKDMQKAEDQSVETSAQVVSSLKELISLLSSLKSDDSSPDAGSRADLSGLGSGEVDLSS